MEFHIFYPIHETALGMAKFRGHQKVIELFSNTDQNRLKNP